MAAAILLLAALCAFGYWRSASSGGSLTAVVSADGRELDRVELSALTQSERRIYPAGDYLLTVEFSPDGVSVTDSNCPTQDCVHTGVIRSGGRSIVCLPARLTIQLTGADSGGVDAVIG